MWKRQWTCTDTSNLTETLHNQGVGPSSFATICSRKPCVSWIIATERTSSPHVNIIAYVHLRSVCPYRKSASVDSIFTKRRRFSVNLLKQVIFLMPRLDVIGSTQSVAIDSGSLVEGWRNLAVVHCISGQVRKGSLFAHPPSAGRCCSPR